MDWEKCSASSAACSSSRVRVDGFEGPRHLLVQLEPLRGDHLFVQRLAEEGMGEAVTHRAQLRPLFQHREVDRLFQGIDEDFFVMVTPATAFSVSRENSRPITEATESRSLHSLD